MTREKDSVETTPVPKLGLKSFLPSSSDPTNSLTPSVYRSHLEPWDVPETGRRAVVVPVSVRPFSRPRLWTRRVRSKVGVGTGYRLSGRTGYTTFEGTPLTHPHMVSCLDMILTPPSLLTDPRVLP